MQPSEYTHRKPPRAYNITPDPPRCQKVSQRLSQQHSTRLARRVRKPNCNLPVEAADAGDCDDLASASIADIVASSAFCTLVSLALALDPPAAGVAGVEEDKEGLVMVSR
jgi:hypothetical protein